MPYITKDYLKQYNASIWASRKQELRNRPQVLNESQKAEYKTTIFLSHSHKDKELVEDVALFLMNQGSFVYVDWKDSSMPESTSSATAEALKKRIHTCDKFIVLASNNALDSKWVPWELGFADAAKGIDKVFVFPVADNDGTWKGSEYFDLYQKIELGHKEHSVVNEAMVRAPHLTYVGSSLKHILKQENNSATYYR